MLLKTKLLLVGGGALALLLAGGGLASASGGGGKGTGPGPGPGPGPRPGPLPAPGGQQARVREPTGMVVRTEPSTRGGNATKTGTVLPAGSIVTVLQTGIPDLDGTPGEWMRLAAPNGVVGYSRYIDRTTQPGTDIYNFELL